MLDPDSSTLQPFEGDIPVAYGRRIRKKRLAKLEALKLIDTTRAVSKVVISIV